MHHSRRQPSAARRVATFSLLLLVWLPVVAGAARGEEPAAVPDEFQGSTSAAGVSMVSFKSPNPLPVGPGAFLTMESPEVHGYLTANSSQARASLLYPGPAVAGSAALFCLAGAQPFCGQGPPPVIAEAEHPQHPEAAVATDQIAVRDPSAPFSTGAGSGQARAEAQRSTSRAELASYSIAPPDPLREAILEALTATLSAIPGATVVPEPAFASIGGGFVEQTIEPADDGAVRAESKAVINDVTLLAGAVTIDSVVTEAFTVNDGAEVREVGSSTKTSGMLVAGFPASMGPEGFSINGEGDDGSGREQLNGVAAQIAEAVTMAVDKLHMEVRDGSATQSDDGTSAAADGLSISFGNTALTESSPPQVPGLCSATGAVLDPLRSGGMPLPPICAVPDATGTSDSYELLLGRAGVALTAQLFGDFSGEPLGEGLASLGAGSTGSGAPPTDLGVDVATPIPSSGGGGATTGAVTPTGPRSILLPVPGDPGFLAFEARWLEDAAERFPDIYIYVAGLATALLLSSQVVMRATRTPMREAS